MDELQRTNEGDMTHLDDYDTLVVTDGNLIDGLPNGNTPGTLESVAESVLQAVCTTVPKFHSPIFTTADDER